ncbi:CidA/LrgA family holin-like protein [Paenibacillus larvae]|uniref:LrgA family protein n=4 Tax=Paenibacillus larvae TaxID=1464 RepID=V9WAA6_9BACL|nr:CidA/LrgA family holin-like protein [Paenibacillus larvae]AHD06779.1 LrgA family protein [Paenibacillus larvae subsp. larvae DSM 25430]AQR77825.1 hypothetical protein BXP28_11220 [Paenibacillus larvae subsp. larvae]AQT84260.1 hypothetical protein B1222_07390 [Paenibacillus larvae subsp. pulvifaciens]AQZ46237.1 hypothetical protein B5S25_05975 [Paenibacillus larvae subsp. pulvifaciens]ARF67568.1 hypothetical protein B7C51_06650 [Paenibacillus larvae subsp. pulvifaciens]
MKKWITIALQMGLLWLFAVLGGLVSDYLHLPISGSIIGIFILFTCLKLRILPLQWFEQGADWLLATLLLFFIPAAVGIIEHSELVSMAGIGLIGMVILSTFLVMSSTGLVAEFISRMRRGNTK